MNRKKLLFWLLLGSLLIFAILFLCYNIRDKRLKAIADFYFQQGNKFLFEGKFKDAISNFEEAGRIYPKLYKNASTDLKSAITIVEQLLKWEEQRIEEKNDD